MSDEAKKLSLLLSSQLLAAKEIFDKLILAQTAHAKQMQDQQTALSEIQGQIIAEKTALFDADHKRNTVESQNEGLQEEKAKLIKDVSDLQRKLETQNTKLQAAKSELGNVKQATKDAEKLAGEVDLSLQKLTKDITAAKNELVVQVKPSKKCDLEEEARQTKAAKRSEKPVVSLLDFEISGEREAKMVKDTARVYLQEKKTHGETVSFNHVRNFMLKDGIITGETIVLWKTLIKTLCWIFSASQAKNVSGLVRYVGNQRKNMQRSPYKKLASGVKKLVQNMDSETLETLKNDEQKHDSSHFIKVIEQANEKTMLDADIPDDILSWMFKNSFVVPKKITESPKKKAKLGTSSVKEGSASSKDTKNETLQDTATESDE